MNDRYKYVRALYGCMFEVHQLGGSCFDPLMFHFPLADATYSNIEHSFVFANILKVTPALEPNVT